MVGRISSRRRYGIWLICCYLYAAERPDRIEAWRRGRVEEEEIGDMEQDVLACFQ